MCSRWHSAQKLGHRGLISNGLVAHYKFNEGSGQVLYDHAAGHHGQLGATSGVDAGSDPAWIASGLDFVATRYVLLPALHNPASGDFTIVCAFRINAGTTAQCLVANLDGSGTGRTLLGAQSTEVLFCNIGGSVQSHTTVMTDESDHVCTMTYTGTTKRLYLDASAAQSASGTAESSDGAWVIGSDKFLGAGWTRRIYYVLVYNRALTAAEVAKNHSYIKKVLALRGVTLA